jgi:hypothetical protein
VQVFVVACRVVKLQLDVVPLKLLLKLVLHHFWIGVQKLVNDDIVPTRGDVSRHDLFDSGGTHVPDFQKVVTVGALFRVEHEIERH